MKHEPSAPSGHGPGVTQVLVFACQAARVADLEAALRERVSAVASVPGSLGTGIYRSGSGEDGRVHLVRIFDSEESLRSADAVRCCDELCACAGPLAEGETREHVLPGARYWLEAAGDSSGAMPTRFKMTVLMFLGMFPVSLGFHHLLRHFPGLLDFPALVDAALMTAVVTIVTMNVAMPILMRLFAGWLEGGPPAPERGA